MGNNPICTNIEQSQALIRKGLSEDTSDMYYVLGKNREPRLTLLSNKPPQGLLNTVPAWSLSALINLLPEFVESEGKEYCLIMVTDRIVYWDGNSTNLFETTENNLIDAVVTTLYWLTDKGYI